MSSKISIFSSNYFALLIELTSQFNLKNKPLLPFSYKYTVLELATYSVFFSPAVVYRISSMTNFMGEKN